MDVAVHQTRGMDHLKHLQHLTQEGGQLLLASQQIQGALHRRTGDVLLDETEDAALGIHINHPRNPGVAKTVQPGCFHPQGVLELGIRGYQFEHNLSVALTLLQQQGIASGGAAEGPDHRVGRVLEQGFDIDAPLFRSSPETQQILRAEAVEIHPLRQPLELHSTHAMGQLTEAGVDQVVGGAGEGHTVRRADGLQARRQVDALANDVITIGVDLAGVEPEAVGQGLPAALTQGLHRRLDEPQGLGRCIEGDQQPVTQGFHQLAAVDLDLITDQMQVLLDPLDGDQLISEDLQ